jgi:microcystin-dependent protein
LKTFHKLSILSYFSVGELPAHNHNVTVSTSGDHAHTFTFVKEYDAGGTEPGSASWRSNQGTKTTEQAGTHTHTVTISNTGSNYPHNNLQPYISVYCWRRTA